MRLTAKTIAEALPNAVPAGPHELAKPARKQLSSLGHLNTRFAEACDKLRRSAEDFPGLEPWLHGFADATPCALGSTGWFAIAVNADANGKLHVESSMVDREWIAPLADSWNRIYPDKLITADSAIEASSSFHAPVWSALLRLRPLREFWERALRRDALATLLDILPDAWLLDPALPPPGAVIPRLEIPSWDHWELRPASTPAVAFTLSPAATHHQSPVHSTTDILTALGQFPSAPHILTAHHPGTEPLLLTFYQRKDSRTDWLGALALTLETPIPKLARVV